MYLYTYLFTSVYIEIGMYYVYMYACVLYIYTEILTYDHIYII